MDVDEVGLMELLRVGMMGLLDAGEVEVEGLDEVVEVEVELDWPKDSRRWLSASPFSFCSPFFFCIHLVPETSSHLLFMDCHVCGVTFCTSARRQSLFPVTG